MPAIPENPSISISETGSDMKKIIRLILVSATVLLCSCDIIINSFSFFPDTSYIINSEKLPAYVKPVMLNSIDGNMLEALCFKHEKKSAKFVIYFHGNAGNLYHRIREATVIYNMGYDLIISGYRGYGRSTGSPSEKGIYSDGKTVLGYVTSNLGYRPEKIYIYGRSLGTTIAVDISQNTVFGGIILVTPLTSAGEFIKEKFPDFLSVLGHNRFDSIGKINNLKSPILVIHGTDDEVIPYHLGIKLFETYTGRKELVTIPGGGHNNLEFIDPDLYWNSVKRFLDK